MGPSLIAVLGANIGPFVSELNSAQSHARRAGEGIGSALGQELTHKLSSIARGAGIEEAVRRTIEWGDAMANLSIRTGLSAKQLQILENIGSKTGASVEQLASLYERLGKAMAIAHKEGPGGDHAEALARLGVRSEAI